jgi:hypothetical protein
MAFGGSFISVGGRSYKGGGRGKLPLVFFLLEAFCVVAFVSLLPTLLFVPVLMIKV